MGYVITFSGVDGAGKSTQIELLMGQLEAKQENVYYIWARIGYTPFFDSLKSGLRRLFRGKAVPPAENVSPSLKPGFRKKEVLTIWLTLSLLELMWIYGIQLRWRRRRCNFVICDRYLWDSLIDVQVYFPQINIESWLLWKLLVRLAPRPDVELFLMLPLDISIKRMKAKNEPDRSLSELQKRNELYERLSRERNLWTVIDSNTTLSEIAAAIRSILDSRIN